MGSPKLERIGKMLPGLMSFLPQTFLVGSECGVNGIKAPAWLASTVQAVGGVGGYFNDAL